MDDYKMLHLLGNPQGPSFSFNSDCALAPFALALGVGIELGSVVPLLSCFVAV